MDHTRLKTLLENAYRQFALPQFVEDDPIAIPAMFSRKEDIEIAGFLTATIAWGQRKSILNSARRMMELMDHAPADFIRHHAPSDRKRLQGFVHRTFQAEDLMYFAEALQHLYVSGGGLEQAFAQAEGPGSQKDRLTAFHKRFFSLPHLERTRKHVGLPAKGSSAKRMNMFLRWMVRPHNEGIDFGLWTIMRPSDLMMPLDVHTGNVGRALGLLSRPQDDWKAVEELTAALRSFDAADPTRFDFALFGLGVAGVNLKSLA